MANHTTHSVLGSTFIVLSLGFLAGCGSSDKSGSAAFNGHASAQTAALSVPGVQRTSSAVEGIRSLRDELTKTRETIASASKSLEDLSTAQGDLLEPFNRFMTHRQQLDQQDQRLADLGDDMRSRARDYITNWEVEVYGVEDPDLRKQAESRRSEVRTNYQKITDSTRSLRESMQPLRKKYSDLNTFLANDLTTGGVKSSATAVREATQSATDVQQKIDKVTADLDRMMQTMTPTVKESNGAGLGVTTPGSSSVESK